MAAIDWYCRWLDTCRCFLCLQRIPIVTDPDDPRAAVCIKCGNRFLHPDYERGD